MEKDQVSLKELKVLLSLATELIRYVMEAVEHTDMCMQTDRCRESVEAKKVSLERAEDKEAKEGSRTAELTGRRLVQEADIRKAGNSGCRSLRIGADTKITPLAMDYIKNHEMSVIRQEGVKEWKSEQ